jgi:CDP-glucose 4,6-dehydratase
MNPNFWKGRRVFITGHTGFKGAWLSLWLQKVDAEVTAFSLAPPTIPNLFEEARVADGITSVRGDIRDYDALNQALHASKAEIVFHLAAQATVAGGYRDARDTFASNLTGTLNLLDSIRENPQIKAAVIVTTDKCYAPATDNVPLKEHAPMGGKDPYSASKSCAEIAVNSWRESFFHASDSPCIATARAGNVIGGGDWAEHRLLPDMVRAFMAHQPLSLRMPAAVRPWQHVLDALHGYLMLAEHLAGDNGRHYARGWNFGPTEEDHRTVAEVAEMAVRFWGDGATWHNASSNFQTETHELRLDATAAKNELAWHPRWRLDNALRHTLEWYRAAQNATDIRALTLSKIETFQATS